LIDNRHVVGSHGPKSFVAPHPRVVRHLSVGIAIRIARGCSMRSGSFFRTAEPRARP